MTIRSRVPLLRVASESGAVGAAVPREWLWLFCILAVGTFLRLVAWHNHALDPDEGAQLMDGRFVLSGLVPFVDFGSRQVVYVWLMAAFIALVGPDFARVRLFVVFADPVNAVLIFLIGRRLFDTRVGLLAAAAYLLLPLAAGLAPIVHTESFAVFFACAAAYCLVRHLQPGGGWGALLAAGMLITAGVYVRESGLAIAQSALLTLALTSWRMPGLLLRRCAVIAVGLLIPCAGVALYYFQFFSPAELWGSHLNPFHLLLLSRSHAPTGLLADISGSFLAGLPSMAGGSRQQPWWATWEVLGQVALVYGPLLAGVALSVAVAVTNARRHQGSPRFRVAASLLYPWAICLGLAYGYWTVRRGFFSEYAVELLPPLVLLCAFAVFEAGRGWQLGPIPGWVTLLLVGCVATILAASHIGSIQFPRFMYVALVPLVVSWPWLREKGIGHWVLIGVFVGLLVLPLGLPKPSQRAIKLAAVGGLILVGWVAARAQGAPGQERLGSLRYAGLVGVGLAAAVLDATVRPRDLVSGATWPPRVVREVSDSLRRRGRATDEVISGGLIWEFQAGLQPFQRITHPLRFEFGLPAEQAADLDARIKATPPRFIVLDGYTQHSYGTVVPDLAQVISDRYEQIVTVPGGKYPVQLYQLREAGPPP